MKYKGINIGLEIAINSGTALLLFIACFFGLLWMAQHHESIERLYPVAIAGLTGAFGGYLIKRNSNNKIELQYQQTVGASNEKTNTFRTSIRDMSGDSTISDTSSGQQKD